MARTSGVKIGVLSLLIIVCGLLVQNILGSVHHTGGLQQLSPWLKINEVDHKKLKEVLSAGTTIM